ncbi:undecaprenyl-diphosphate phosphatase [Candidatus Caldatribacterium saccharofermentans]|uniref:undecaprenyl-diphosphate phosphatase n=1 Tax=Candidatus Caldatribacterium saccharofermentans TaxID=1454753 RepID=UPI003D02A807
MVKLGTTEGLVLGLIQGLTEFFPISSSAHLLLLRTLFPLGEAHLSLDVLLHTGTWLAVLLVFLPSTGRVLRRPSIVLKVLIATIPAGVFGYLLEDQVETVFRDNLFLVSAVLLGVGIIFLLVRHEGEKTLEAMNIRDAVIIGLFQALALIPGVSRSGITILGGIGVGLKRSEAVIFSFLLSLTTIGGATALVLLREASGGMVLFKSALPGFFAALGSGLLSCIVLLRLVREKGLAPFGYYRILLGAFFLLFLSLR